MNTFSFAVLSMQNSVLMNKIMKQCWLYFAIISALLLGVEGIGSKEYSQRRAQLRRGPENLAYVTSFRARFEECGLSW